MKGLNKLFLHESSPCAGRYYRIQRVFSRMEELGRFHDFSKGEIISFHFYTQTKILPFKDKVIFKLVTEFTKLKLKCLFF